MSQICTDMHMELDIAIEMKCLFIPRQINDQQSKTLVIYLKSSSSDKAKVNPVKLPNWDTLLPVLSDSSR